MRRRLPRVAVGGRVGLRPAAHDDLATFYGWRDDLLQFDLLGWVRNTVTFEQFSREMELHLRNSCSLVGVDAETDEPLGLVFAYEMNPIDGWCSVLVYAAHDHRRQALGREAAFLFWDYLFRDFRLRKIYMDVFEFNQGWVESTPALEAGLMVEEGRFRQHIPFNGRLWDVIRLALYRERWMRMRDFLLLLVGSESPRGPTSSEHAERDGQGADGSSPRDAHTEHAAREAEPERTPGHDGGVSNIELARRYLACVRGGDAEGLAGMLARDVTFDSPVTGTLAGRAFLQKMLRDRHAMAARLEDGRGVGRQDIVWSHPEQHGDTVRIVGSHAPDGTIEVTWTFNAQGEITAWSWHGPTQLLVSYYLSGAVPGDGSGDH